METAKLVGSRLRDARKAKGLTQKEVAAQLHISRSYVSRIEKNALQKLRELFE